jgi:2,5-diketo-D-gluconate reductase A
MGAADPTGPSTADARGRSLGDGTVMPLLGFGVWQVTDGRECVRAVRWALEAGYRHLDTAQAYGNEQSVGRALRESGLAREDVYLTTKFHPRQSDPLREIAHSVDRLGVDYVDLYLVHWPEGGATWAWPEMEHACERSYTRSIGVSNFAVGELHALMAVARTPPVVDQVEFSPFAFREGLARACAQQNVVLEAYSPLGTGTHLTDPTVAAIAQRVERTPAQVLLRWCVQRGVPAVSKSTHRDRIEENARVFDFSLSPADMAELNSLDRSARTDRALERPWWPTSS